MTSYGPVPGALVGDASAGESGHLHYVLKDVEDVYKRLDEAAPEAEAIVLHMLASARAHGPPRTSAELKKRLQEAAKGTGSSSLRPKRELLRVLRRLKREEKSTSVAGSSEEEREATSLLESIERLLVTRSTRTESGILSVTVLTAPSFTTSGSQDKKIPFSCAFDCFYCPNEPGQPRSYLRDEPAVLRANQCSFDPVLQFIDRCGALYENGHVVDKIELLILGGTWSSYPLAYREEFCRDLYFAANTFMKSESERNRARGSLEEEMRRNTAQKSTRIIGLTLETRPDQLTCEELVHFRRVGCTRVQLGLQSTHDVLLRRLNRGCTTSDAIRGIRLLKQAGFKVDAHLMPNLPGATPEMDEEMLRRVALTDPDLAVDQLKIYPCAIVPFTQIEKWYKNGTYVPYPMDVLTDLIIDFKVDVVPPWIRLNRVVRDIPTTYQVAAGTATESILVTDYRNDVHDEMKRRGVTCKCIRCREIGLETVHETDEVRLVVRTYDASRGTEHFISFETKNDDRLLGFCRLRLNGDPRDELVFPELRGMGLIRELHVYGLLVSETKTKKGPEPQHAGLGTRLVLEAARLARASGCAGLAVIPGEGVRNFYAEKLGFKALEEDAAENSGRFMFLAFRDEKTSGGEKRVGAWAARLGALGLALAWWMASVAKRA